MLKFINFVNIKDEYQMNLGIEVNYFSFLRSTPFLNFFSDLLANYLTNVSD